jgi:hypothetical protein
MPKILVLFAGQPTTMVNAVADGARSVRFSEVELRRVDTPSPTAPDEQVNIHQTLTGIDEIALYDAVVVAVSADGRVHPELSRLLAGPTETAPRSAWQNKVGAAFPAEPGESAVDVWPALATLGDIGMLVVAPYGGSADAARELGARVAQVVGWVTHARSHHHHAH